MVAADSIKHPAPRLDWASFSRCDVPVVSAGIRWFKGPRRWIPLVIGGLLAVAATLLRSGLVAIAAFLALLDYARQAVPEWWRERQDVHQRRRKTLREATSTSTNTGKSLRVVSEVGLIEMRVHPARIQLDYQERSAARNLRSALLAGRPVLLVGPSMAGKSRLGAEVVRELYADHPLLIPLPERLPDLLLEGAPASAVVWLDDLERYLVQKDLRTDWVTHLTSGGSVVLATMRASEHASFIANGEIRHPQWSALEQFELIRVEDDNPEENLRLSSALSTVEARGAVERVGLGAYLGGGPIAVHQLEGSREAHPLGVAMVRAAADWRRIGIVALELSELRQLAPAYLQATHRVDCGESFEEGLRWATQRIEQLIQLLQYVEGNRVECSDYIVDYLSDKASNAEVPDSTWIAGVESLNVNAEELTNVGVRAAQSGRDDFALRAYARAAEPSPDHPNGYALAALNLGILLDREGKPDLAADAYQQAIDSNERAIRPLAELNLGMIYRQENDFNRARIAFTNASQSGHPVAAPMAMFNLGFLEEESGNINAAREAYGRAVGSWDADQASRAALNLGHLERLGGHLDASRDLFQKAIDSQHASAMPRALLGRAQLEEEAGKPDLSRVLYRRAIRTDHEDAAPRAHLGLGLLERNLGNIDPAREALRNAMDSAHEDAAPRAALALGLLEQDLGRSDDARACYGLAIDAKHHDASPSAYLALGYLEELEGNLEAARAAYHRAASSGPSNVAVAAKEAMRRLGGN